MSSAGGGRPRTGGKTKAEGGAVGDSRGNPHARGRAIPLADVVDVASSGEPLDEDHPDEDILEGMETHLDDDRMFDPQDFDPVERSWSDLSGNRGRPILEIYLHEQNGGDSVRHRVLDDPGAASDDDLSAEDVLAVDHEQAQQRYELLEQLGEFIVRWNKDAAGATTPDAGRAALVRATRKEIKDETGIGHDWINRSQWDLIEFPWGAVPLDDLLSDLSSEVTEEQVVKFWETLVPLLRALSSNEDDWERGTKTLIQDKAAKQSGVSDAMAKKLAPTSRRLFWNAKKVWSAAQTCVDVDAFRVALERLGINCEPKHVYSLVFHGRLRHPEDIP